MGCVLPGFVIGLHSRSEPLKRPRGTEDGSAAARGRVALVDDEPLFRQALSQSLAEAGFEVAEFESGQTMLAYLNADNEVHLIILDWKMPLMNGIDVLKQLRQDGYETPVIFLTGLSHAIYEEAALAGGAVDFIGKSRGFAILLKRAELSLRRARTRERRAAKAAATTATGSLKVGDLDLFPEANRAVWKGKAIKLTLSEFQMVRLMAEHAGDHIPYQQLYKVVLAKHTSSSDEKTDLEANVRTFIKRIRRGFVEIDAGFDRIENYAKFGYRWRR
jgi:two-component system, OmpR family, response regulator ChvI